MVSTKYANAASRVLYVPDRYDAFIEIDWLCRAEAPTRRVQLVEHAIPVAGWKKMYNPDTDIIGY